MPIGRHPHVRNVTLRLGKREAQVLNNDAVTLKPTSSVYRSTPQNDRWLLVALLIFIAIAPLPLGSNRPLPMALLGCYAALLLIWWSILLGLNRTTAHQQFRSLRWPMLLYLAVCAWIAIQALPGLSAPLADPIWQSTESIINTVLPKHMSVNPEASITGLSHLLTYGIVFWLAFQLTQTQKRAWAVIRVISAIGCIYALYGIIIYMTGNGWILIYPKWSYQNSLTSTFVNRNSYATFAGLGLICAVVLLLNHMTPYFALKHPIRAKIVIIVEELLAKSAWKAFSVVAIAISLLLSTSRGGLASSLIGLLAIALIYLAQQKLRLSGIIYTAAIVISLAITVFLASGNFVSQRFETDQVDSSFTFRFNMYALTWDAITTAPLKGTGFGTYTDVIPAYKEPGSALQFWDKAHNSYLENALELGLPAAFLLNMAIGLIALRTVVGAVRRKRNKLLPALGIGATILVGIHSLVDFSLQIPAVTILYACIMGVAASQSWSQKSSSTTDYGRSSRP